VATRKEHVAGLKERFDSNHDLSKVQQCIDSPYSEVMETRLEASSTGVRSFQNVGIASQSNDQEGNMTKADIIERFTPPPACLKMIPLP